MFLPPVTEAVPLR